jgi:hypothetical protein
MTVSTGKLYALGVCMSSANYGAQRYAAQTPAKPVGCSGLLGFRYPTPEDQTSKRSSYGTDSPCSRYLRRILRYIAQQLQEIR